MKSQRARRWAIGAGLCMALASMGCDGNETQAGADGGAGGMAGAGGAGGMAGAGGAGGMMTEVGVSDPAARACEVLFTASPAAQVSVTFGDAITGTWRRREERVAVGFFHRADDAIPAGALSVSGVDPTPEVVRCYDRLGAPLAGVDLILE